MMSVPQFLPEEVKTTLEIKDMEGDIIVSYPHQRIGIFQHFPSRLSSFNAFGGHFFERDGGSS